MYSGRTSKNTARFPEERNKVRREKKRKKERKNPATQTIEKVIKIIVVWSKPSRAPRPDTKE
jgi:hypothetical protein